MSLEPEIERHEYKEDTTIVSFYVSLDDDNAMLDIGKPVATEVVDPESGKADSVMKVLRACFISTPASGAPRCWARGYEKGRGGMHPTAPPAALSN